VKVDEQIIYLAFQQFGNVTAVTIKSKVLDKVKECLLYAGSWLGG
jgi:hypothetical protein